MSDHDEKSSSSPMSMPAQSPITEPTNHTTDNNNDTAASPTQAHSASKRSRGRPRKYHTDAEREEAKRRYRENHKTKAASAGGVGGGANAANASAAALNAAAAASFTPIQPAAKQQDIDELWEAIRALQGEVERLKAESMQRDAAAAAALPGQKRRKVPSIWKSRLLVPYYQELLLKCSHFWVSRIDNQNAILAPVALDQAELIGCCHTFHVSLRRVTKDSTFFLKFLHFANNERNHDFEGWDLELLVGRCGRFLFGRLAMGIQLLLLDRTRFFDFVI
ncbi:uncharacterized protein M437DRAFT_67501 [Aureobasidium melanogenum CBS 110374]|uniref:Uncharacterized protein n=1 Tax=Aureobasidium melanogenum (strain CBS 110374) TaxID=1043003 RepID=A0A074VTW3_AURM1|nr:uncharacterized protein M437DRAFT_67501 [Aureobasidium melanogenum CBS 110374]KEQ61122.1 hypothetical protein M437DRAFT_67501 [Aureobasidium melanogenum CBS 110374]